MLYGEKAGDVALLLWCFSPTIIGNAALITPDAHAASLAITASFLFNKWMVKRSLKYAIAAGLLLGFAVASKSTLLSLFLAWPAVFLVALLSDKSLAGHRMQFCGVLLGILSLGILTLDSVYIFSGCFRTLEGMANDFVSSPARGLVASFVGQIVIWLRLPMPLPEDLILGIDLQWADSQERVSYLLGELSPRGWVYFYFVGAVIKEPLGMWGLVALALVRRGLRLRRGQHLCGALVIPPTVLFLLVSLNWQMTAHFRYALPCLPFLYVWTSQCAGIVSRCALLRWVYVLLLSWIVSSSLLIFPHSLGYFNELAGGPWNARHAMLDSNSDWGQDLLFFAKWRRVTPASTVHTAIYSGVPLGAMGIQHCTPARPVRESNQRAYFPAGTYAISLNYLKGYAYNLIVDRSRDIVIEDRSLRIFDSLTPRQRVGFSILIYELRDPLYYDPRSCTVLFDMQ